MSTHRLTVTLDPGPPDHNPRITVASDMLELLPETERATILDVVDPVADVVVLALLPWLDAAHRD